jgi:hypothetical protein
MKSFHEFLANGWFEKIFLYISPESKLHLEMILKIGISPTHTWITVQFQYFQLFSTEGIGFEVSKSCKYQNCPLGSPNILKFAESTFVARQNIGTWTEIKLWIFVACWKYWNWTVIHVWVGESPIFELLSKCKRWKWYSYHQDMTIIIHTMKRKKIVWHE